MQGGDDASDYISRAKARAAEWEEMRLEQDRARRFDNCTADELIRIAETGRDLIGNEMQGGDWYALDGVWTVTFGEGLGSRSTASQTPEIEQVMSQHPLLAVPDDQMIRPRDVVRLCGIPRTTLKRWRREGRFPMPQRLSPHAKHVGWPARQIKEWLRAGQS